MGSGSRGRPANGGEERVGGVVLTDEGGGAGFAAAVAERVVVLEAQHHDAARKGKAGDSLTGGHAVHDWHVDVQDDYIGFEVDYCFDTCRAVGGFTNDCEVFIEEEAHAQSATNIGVVIDEQDANGSGHAISVRARWNHGIERANGGRSALGARLPRPFIREAKDRKRRTSIAAKEAL
jgi:hypothetical protein